MTIQLEESESSDQISECIQTQLSRRDFHRLDHLAYFPGKGIGMPTEIIAVGKMIEPSGGLDGVAKSRLLKVTLWRLPQRINFESLSSNKIQSFWESRVHPKLLLLVLIFTFLSFFRVVIITAQVSFRDDHFEGPKWSIKEKICTVSIEPESVDRSR